MARPVFKARNLNTAAASKPAKRSRSFNQQPVDSPSCERTDGLPRTKSPEEEEEGDVLWVFKHAPHSYEELALHKGKLGEITSALNPKSENRVVVLSGPAGSSKSSAVRVACIEEGRTLVEYVPPESSIGATGIVSSFREFLVGASMYKRHSTTVLVEDLPNVFHEETRRAFDAALMDWANEKTYTQPILVVSFSEIEVSAHYSDAVVVPRVLSGLITLQRHFKWIKVNPVNATLIMKALKTILLREQQQCSPVILKEIAQCGDIRNAIIAVEIFAKGRELHATRSITRGFPVQLFHAVGKVIYGTSKEGSLEEALDAFSETLDTLNLSVLDNYCSAKHSRLGIHAAASVAEHLSEADTNPSLAVIGTLAAAETIRVSEPDANAVRKFESLKFTQYPRWRREEHELRSTLIAQRSEDRVRCGPTTFASALLDDRGYDSHLRKPADLLPDISSDEDDF